MLTAKPFDSGAVSFSVFGISHPAKTSNFNKETEQ